MEKDIKEYLEIVSEVSAVDVGWIAESLEEYAGTHEDLTVDEVEEQIWAYIHNDVEDSNRAFDLSRSEHAQELLKNILSDLEDYQEGQSREHEEEVEAMNRAYRHAKGFS